MTAQSTPLSPGLTPTSEFADAPALKLERSGGWTSVAIMLVILLSVTWSVEAAKWSDGLILVQLAVIAGALIGLLLSLTRWGFAFSVVYSLAIGLIWVSSSASHIMLEQPDLHLGILDVLQRTGAWISALVNRTPSSDNLLFVLQLCLVAWWMAHFAMWSVIRHQRVWLAVLPAGVGLVFNAYYSPLNLTPYVLVFLMGTVMLAVRVELARNEMTWQVARIRYAPDIYFDFLREGVVFAVLLVAVAWMMPDASRQGTLQEALRPFRAPWQEVQDNWNRMFGALNYPAQRTVGFFGKTMTLGGAVTLSDRPVFEGQTPERTYWQAGTYDTYTGRQWLNTDDRVVSVDRNGLLPQLSFALTHQFTVTIRTFQPDQQTVFGGPGALRTSLPVNAEVNVIQARSAAGVRSTLYQTSLLRSQIQLDQDAVYQTVSQASSAAPDLLRQDDAPYPVWAGQRYLQIPDTLPARVRALAAQIVAAETNAYDKAGAIETFLRRIPYTTNIAPPPSGADGVDYFLFDARKGYCDYYASAMVVMLRSVGVAARFVVGYAPGDFSPDTNTYQVLERHAHAWVEVLFPGYGWVQFEPTASQPSLVRPALAGSAVDEGPSPNEPDSPPEDDALRPQPAPAMPLASSGLNLVEWIVNHVAATSLITALLTVLAVGAAWLARFHRRRRQVLAPDPGLLLRLFSLLSRWAARLHIPWPVSHTPLEHARAVERALPEAGVHVLRLAVLYTAEEYGRQQIGPESLQEVAAEWKLLQPVFWKRWLALAARRLRVPIPQRP